MKLVRLFRVLFAPTYLLLLLSFPASSIGEPQPIPSVSEIEKLNFSGVKDIPRISYYDDVCETRSLFVAFRTGSEALSKYHEPVATRGSQGMSVFKSVSPAVVVVVVGTTKNDKFSMEGLGSGALIDTRGYVLTNWHVINGHSDAVVFLKPTGSADIDKSSAFGARVIYENSTIDLALLKLIDAPTGLPSLGVGDISTVQVAEDIHIVGHPHGNLWSYSTGVVSQIRDDYSWTYDDGSKHEAKVLQLQTAINPGNSGGPVVDDSGEILGLVAMSEEGQNLNYAIAADVIKPFLGTGMQMSTRGISLPTKTSASPDQVLSAKLNDKLFVTKWIYKDVVLYSINEMGGPSIGLVAKFSDGTVIKAWDAREEDGGFKSWSQTSLSGPELLGVSSGGMLKSISIK
jgi:S1-C subfamily serine protease